MNSRFKYLIILFIPLLLFSSTLKAQAPANDWFHIPGFTPESPLTMTDEKSFLVIMGGAALSYALSEYVFKNEEQQDFYQVRIGMNKEHAWGHKTVWSQNFGVERRVAPWFAIAVEFNLQEWNDQTSIIASKDKFGIGTGLMTYYRWHIFGRKKISPFLEYGAGVFMGFKKFPYNGSHFTFNNSTKLGIEYTFPNQNKLRIAYGQNHQSNYGLADSDPSYNGDGFTVGYAWFWK